jgi:RHS repeat-associated protein
MEVGGNGALYRAYLYGKNTLVAQLAPDGQFYWQHNQHLGSGYKLTSNSGTVVYRGEFDPQGQTLLETGSTTLNSHKFTGYEKDQSTGLDYANARMYSGSRGRFTKPDPAGLSAADARPQTLNRYSYVNNDPVNFVDRTGLGDCGFLICDSITVNGSTNDNPNTVPGVVSSIGTGTGLDHDQVEEDSNGGAGFDATYYAEEQFDDVGPDSLERAFKNVDPNCLNEFSKIIEGGLSNFLSTLTNKPMNIVNLKTHGSAISLVSGVNGNGFKTFNEIWKDQGGDPNALAKAAVIAGGLRDDRTILVATAFFEASSSWNPLIAQYGGFNTKIRLQSAVLVHEMVHIATGLSDQALHEKLKANGANLPDAPTESKAIVAWQAKGCPVKK